MMYPAYNCDDPIMLNHTHYECWPCKIITVIFCALFSFITVAGREILEQEIKNKKLKIITLMTAASSMHEQKVQKECGLYMTYIRRWHRQARALPRY